MELLVHASTSGHLLVDCTLEVVTVGPPLIDVHVIMATPTAHLLLWVMTIFVSVLVFRAQAHYNAIFYPNATLWDGQVCEGGGTCCKLNNPPWFIKNLTQRILSYDCVLLTPVRKLILHLNYWNCMSSEH